MDEELLIHTQVAEVVFSSRV